MRRLHADLVITGVLVTTGLAMAVYAISYRVVSADGGIGPGFMPFAAGLALAGFSGLAGAQIIVRNRRGTGDGVDQPPGVAGDESDEPRVRTYVAAERRVSLVFVLILGAILLSSLVGFLVAFGLLVFVLLAVVERERVWLAGTITVVAVGFCYLVFVQTLQIPLPGGVLHLLGNG